MNINVALSLWLLPPACFWLWQPKSSPQSIINCPEQSHWRCVRKMDIGGDYTQGQYGKINVQQPWQAQVDIMNNQDIKNDRLLLASFLHGFQIAHFRGVAFVQHLSNWEHLHRSRVGKCGVGQEILNPLISQALLHMLKQPDNNFKPQWNCILKHNGTSTIHFEQIGIRSQLPSLKTEWLTRIICVLK